MIMRITPSGPSTRSSTMSDVAVVNVPDVATGDDAGTGAGESLAWEDDVLPNDPEGGLCMGHMSAGTAPIGNRSS